MLLNRAVQRQDLSAVRELLQSDTDVNAKNDFGWTPLHLAARYRGEQALELVEALVGHGADVHAKDNRGHTPLHLAVQHGCEHAVELVEAMMGHGADVHAKNIYGHTPLHLAVQHGREYAVELVEAMMGHGADVHAKNKYGWTSLHIAVVYGANHAAGLIQALIGHGADVHATDKDGETPLQFAVKHGGHRTLKLVEAMLGADGNRRRTCDVSGPPSTERLVTLFLDGLQGLEEVGGLKETLRGIVQQVRVRRSEGRDTAGLLRNYLFYGSAGTGKTTGVQKLAGVLCACGLLKKNHVEETSAKGLTGEYLGQSKTRVEEAMEAARGGVLFVDEAYTLGGDPYGDEAMAKLLSMMAEDGYRKNTVVVMAGSRDRMGVLLQRNERLQSRFTETVEFPDWSPAQCTRFVQKLADEAQPRPFVFEPACKEAVHASLDQCFAQLRQRPGWANARDVRRMFDDVVGQRDKRLAEALDSTDSVRGITAEDTAAACTKFLAARIDPRVCGSGRSEVQTPQQHYQNTMQESTESLICYLAEPGLQDTIDC